MNKIRFVLNRSGVRELLKSDAMSRICEDHAARTLAGCSEIPGYKMERRAYPERTGYVVFADEYPAIADNLSHNTLLKALK